MLDKCHRVRNHGEYEGMFEIDDQLLNALIQATHQVAKALDSVVQN